MIVRSLAACAAALGLALASPQAHATLLIPGGTVVPNAQLNPLAGTTIDANTGVQAYSVTSGTASMTGTGQAWVVHGYASNPFGAANETFVYQVSLTGGTLSNGSPAIIERLTHSTFDAFLTDVGYFQQNGAQIIPPFNDRTVSGAIVDSDFTTAPIMIGATSALIIINTNAPNFTSGNLSVQDGLTANLIAFSPTVVPEPATWAMALSAVPFLGLAAWRRRRKVA
jgi:hypothetical protein